MKLTPFQGSVLSCNSGKFLVQFARIYLLNKEENKTHSVYCASSSPVRKVVDNSYFG